MFGIMFGRKLVGFGRGGVRVGRGREVGKRGSNGRVGSVLKELDLKMLLVVDFYY